MDVGILQAWHPASPNQDNSAAHSSSSAAQRGAEAFVVNAKRSNLSICPLQSPSLSPSQKACQGTPKLLQVYLTLESISPEPSLRQLHIFVSEKKEIITTYYSGLKFFQNMVSMRQETIFKKIFGTSTPDPHLSPSFDGWKTTPEDKSLETHTARKRQS